MTDLCLWESSDLIPVLNLMLFPDDGERLAFEKAILGKALGELIEEKSEAGEAPCDPSFVRDLTIHETKYVNIIDDAFSKMRLRYCKPQKIVFPPAFAGELLLLILFGYIQGKSFGKDAVYRLYPKNSERYLQRKWRKYAPVAHLWAAFLLLGELPTSEDGIIDFLSVAESIRIFGITYKAGINSSTPIIDPAVSIAITGDCQREVVLDLRYIFEINQDACKELDLCPLAGMILFSDRGPFPLSE